MHIAEISTKDLLAELVSRRIKMAIDSINECYGGAEEVVSELIGDVEAYRREVTENLGFDFTEALPDEMTEISDKLVAKLHLPL